jgi:hypothetical protein
MQSGTQLTPRYKHDQAARLAGEVFGKILNREADREGYAYVLDCLEGGKKTIQQIVLEFISSDEFIDKFASSDDVAYTASLVNKLLLGRPLRDDLEFESARREFLKLGLRRYAEKLVLSQEYARKVGPDRVPGAGH